MPQYENIKVKSIIVNNTSPWLLYALPICHCYLPWLFDVAICCDNFVVATCCWNLPWLLVMGIYGSYRLWEYTDAILHTNLLWLFGRYAETFYFFFFHNEKYFFNLRFSFAYLMAVMHHCKKEIITRKKIFKNDILQSNIFFLPFFFLFFFVFVFFVFLLFFFLINLNTLQVNGTYLYHMVFM